MSARSSAPISGQERRMLKMRHLKRNALPLLGLLVGIGCFSFASTTTRAVTGPMPSCEGTCSGTCSFDRAKGSGCLCSGGGDATSCIVGGSD